MNTGCDRTAFLSGILLLLGGCASMQSGSPEEPQQPSQSPATVVTAALEQQPAPAAGALPPTPGAISQTPEPEPDFWQNLRNGFRLPDKQKPTVIRRAADYGRSAAHVERIFRRGEPYLAYINAEVEKRGFPSEITLLPFVESGYDPFAYSHGRAAGLWQFIPGTGKLYGLKQDWWHDERRDIIASTRAALDYLDWLQQEFDGDWLLALAAYNSGSGTVRKAARKNRKAGKPVDFWHLDLPRETSSYVPKLLAISKVVEQPRRYGVTLLPVDENPDFAVVETGGQLDIAIAADLADLEVDELYALNPAFNRWATHPQGPHRLLLPASKADVFESNLDALPEEQRMKWVRHEVRRGETLSHIALRYDTKASVVRQTNDLDSNTIRSGTYLLVPVAAKDASRYAAPGKSRRSPGSASRSTSYTVKAGDSLWKIARRHNATVAQLTQWNGLRKGSVIKPGQKLVIRKGSAGASGGKQVRTVRYTVRKGDSLFLISRKFNVSVAELRSWNGLSGQKYLQPGQQLKVRVDVTQQSDASRS
jgi:membrane-bound lytic murein transglycosylase D